MAAFLGHLQVKCEEKVLGKTYHTGHTGTRITQTNLTTIQPTNPRPSGRGPHTVAGSREARGEATGTALATTVAAAALTGKKTPGGAGTYRFKDTGGSRDTHETDTRTSQTVTNKVTNR